MRLLKVDTQELKEIFGSEIPDYSILSHCWGSDEVTFQDLAIPGWRDKSGAKKINFACKQSERDDLEYVWVDTCCIDKTSSAELSEAISSMYNWYHNARICYVYLEDVDGSQISAFIKSSDQKTPLFMHNITNNDMWEPERVPTGFPSQWFLGPARSGDLATCQL